MKIRNYKLKIVIPAFVIFFLLSVVSSSDAAELFFDAKAQEVGIGQQFQVDLMLDTEGEIINAIEGEIAFPKELLEIREIRDGDTIINLWVERPAIKPTDKVIFSGIIPTGFEGVLSPYYEGYGPGKIFSLIFTSKKEGEGTIDFINGKVLLHDGLGTPADIEISNFQFSISKEAPGFEFQTPKDTEAPESFVPEVSRDPNIFDGKWFLVFATQDKGSGIDHYEVLERRELKIQKLGFSKEKSLHSKFYILNPWRVAESPYLLKDQELKSYIYVKAIDKAGNERVATLSPRNLLKWYEIWWLWGIIIIGIIIIYAVWRILRKKH